MDTPDCNKIGTPASKIEDSPVFNYINSLSPIKPVKSIHATQAFQSLNFSTIPSIFSSPHLNTAKEVRFLSRHSSEIVRPEVFLDGKSILDSTSNATRDANFCEPSCSLEVKPSEFSKGAGQYSVGEDVVLALIDTGGSLTLSPSKGSEGCSIDGEGHVQETCQADPNGDEASCDWETLIFDSTIENEPINKSSDPDTIGGSCDIAEFLSDTNGVDMSEDNLVGVSGETSNDSEKMDIAERIPVPSETTVSNLNHSVRRRCLIFEASGARQKKFIGSSCRSQSDTKVSGAVTQIVPANPNTEPVHCVLPGIGLHLNSLATASRLTIVKQQMTVSPDVVGSRSAISIVPLALSGQKMITTAAQTSPDVDKDVHKSGSLDGEDTSQTSEHLENEELNSVSPKKKRQRVEQPGESRACKHCNCKKSKCLKLYCECFAAGVYCIDPCACQDCFNKPVHEETVITTRKQIQSRNPLAFAPKVVRGSENAAESGMQEASSKTPASARHKRGCNCKKSSCLKKYCECYQVGVGCSDNCRCEGCKNAFGQKDAVVRLESPSLTREVGETSEHSETGPGRYLRKPPGITYISDGRNPDAVLPRTPLHTFRPAEQLPVSSKGKPPRSSFIRIGSSSGIHISGRSFLHPESKSRTGDEMPEILQGESSPKDGIRVVSPNKKRVSPPHCDPGSSPSRRSVRRLILQSIPSFPPLTPQH